jgi:hypothetical protein
VTGNETACKMGVSWLFVKPLSTQSLLTYKSETTHLNRRCWHFCWHFLSRIRLFLSGMNDIPEYPLYVEADHQ